MSEELSRRLNELARRAGLASVPPAAVAAVLVVCLLVVGAAAWRWWPREASSATETVERVGADPAAAGHADTGTSDAQGAAGGATGVGGEAGDASGTVTARVYIHVVGAVRRPGMYELAGGSRVADAIDAAGGLLANAAQAGVNLARAVSDGEQIVVPTADEFARSPSGPGAGGAGGAPGTGVGAASSGAGASAGAPVNINTADAAALDGLPGVGPSTAAKIVADREANGPFSSADDLGRVAGIGPKKLEELKPRVCVR